MRINSIESIPQKPYGLVRIISSIGPAWLKRQFYSGKNRILPVEIGGYRYKYSLKKIGPKHSYRLAIYIDKKGKKYFAKMRDARIKDYHYYSLLNEAVVSSVLTTAMVRSKSGLSKDLARITIPKFIQVTEIDGWLVLLTEFVKGKNIEKTSVRTKLDNYFLVSRFLSALGRNLTPSEKKLISRRSILNTSLLFPLIWFKTLFNFPGSVDLLMRAALVFYLSIPAVIDRKHEELIHRDLHFSNILKEGHKLKLVDLQQCVYGDQFHEYVTTLRYFWADRKFSKNFCGFLSERIVTSKKDIAAFRFYLINSLVHGLTDKTFKKQILNSWLELLSYASESSFNNLLTNYAK